MTDTRKDRPAVTRGGVPPVRRGVLGLGGWVEGEEEPVAPSDRQFEGGTNPKGVATRSKRSVGVGWVRSRRRWTTVRRRECPP